MTEKLPVVPAGCNSVTEALKPSSVDHLAVHHGKNP